jgi:heme exporter protein D
MQWHSAAEFFAMGGYAFYVWGSFGLCAVALVAEPLLLRRRRRDIERALKRRRAQPTGAWTGARAEETR